MELSEEQLVALDEYDWFDGSSSTPWGETAYAAATAGYDGRGDLDSSEWVNYVRYTLAVDPESAPSPLFCRRIALWWDYRLSEDVESLNTGHLAYLAAEGLLARFEDVLFSSEEMSRVVTSLADGAKGSAEWAYLDATLNHPSITSDHLDDFWRKSEQSSRMLLEALPYLAAHPMTSKELLGSIQELVSSQVKNRPDQLEEWRWNFCYSLAAQHLASREELPFWKRLKFSKWKNLNLKFSDYYLGGVKPLFQNLMIAPEELTINDIACKNQQWVEAFAKPGAKNEEAGLVGLVYGAGSDGVPNGITLLLALRWWAYVTESREDELPRHQRPIWLLPYLEGAVRWVHSLEDGEFKNVPFEWLTEVLALTEPLSEENLMLSPEWLEGASHRGKSAPSH